MSTSDFVLLGSTVKIQPPSGSLGKHYVSKLQQYGDQVALIHEVDGVEVSVTYSQLLRHGKVVAGLLREHGLGSGDTVMLCCGNTLENVAIMLGTLFIGAAIAPVNPSFVTNDILHAVETNIPQIVISNTQAEPSVQEALAQYNTPVVFIPLETVNKRLKENPDVEDFYLGQVDDPDTHVAFVMCSSGTTGKPKGVELTHAAWIIRMRSLFFPNWNDVAERQEVTLNTLGTHWISGVILITFSLSRGNKLLFLPPQKYFLPENFLAVIQKHRVNNVFLGPGLLLALASCSSTEEYNLTSLRSVVYGGASASSASLARVRINFRINITVFYGMTECLGFVPECNDKESELANVGRPISGAEVKIADIVTGLPLGPNMKGEIRVKSATSFKGYRGNPEATKEAFDDDGYLHSGDIGYYNEDGYFFVLDRIKETFKYAGIFVCMSDIEEVLLQHPEVSEAAVVGIYRECRTKATAFIVLCPGATVTEQQLVKLVEDKLPDYKRLHGGAHFVESLPRTSAGKLKKFEIRKQYEPTLSN